LTDENHKLMFSRWISSERDKEVATGVLILGVFVLGLGGGELVWYCWLCSVSSPLL